MRRNGSVTSASGLLPFGHVGWGFRGRDDFDRRAAEYLADGLRQRQWVELVGTGGRQALEQQVSALPEGARALADGRAGVTPIGDYFAYDADGIVDPKPSVDRCVEALEGAIKNGFSGVRVIVDATSVAGTTEHRDAFAEFEHIVDRCMATMPMSALCGYDLDELGESAAELICLHPLTDPTSGPFRLFAGEEGGMALAGELDLTNRQLFELTCQRLLPRLDGDIVIDVADVPYMEHNAMVTLDEVAAQCGRPILLCNADQITVDVVDLLELNHVKAELRC